MQKLIFFGTSLTVIAILIIIAGVTNLNPVDRFSETPDMAVSLVNDAIDLYDDIDTNAFPRIDVDPEFQGMELYVYVIRDSDGIIVAHGEDKSLIGKNADSIGYIDGENVGDVIHDLATENGAWVQYTAEDPVNKELLPESAWIKKHDGYIFGSGIFHPNTNGTVAVTGN
jgi:signal transduction histidine kinase